MSAVNSGAPKPKPETNNKENSMTSRLETLTIEEDVKEGEAEDEGLPVYPYERLKTTSSDPITDIDVTKREVTYWYCIITIIASQVYVFNPILMFLSFAQADLLVIRGVQGEFRNGKGCFL